MAKTLVLVDAQKGFWSNAKKVKEQLQAVLNQAEEIKQKVVVLEYTISKYSRTHDDLMSILKQCGADNVCYAEKHNDDGHAEVLKAMKKRGWNWDDGVEVCGVNLCYCVMDTACSLASHMPVELIRNATACWDYCECKKDDHRVISHYERHGVKIQYE
jgi:hypothetical protein